MELQSLYGNEQVVKERLAIEKYLLFDFNCKDYIVARIKQLASGSCLSQYRWNSGVTFHNQPWNSQQYPCDAYIVMNLFFRFLDELCPGQGLYSQQLFTQKYVVQASSKGNQFSKQTGIRIRQHSKFPPHYQILVDSTCYDVCPVINILIIG